MLSSQAYASPKFKPGAKKPRFDVVIALEEIFLLKLPGAGAAGSPDGYAEWSATDRDTHLRRASSSMLHLRQLKRETCIGDGLPDSGSIIEPAGGGECPLTRPCP